METHDLLDKYIRKYYADWLRCSRRWCSQLGIYTEAYDLLADVLERLCNESPEQIDAMVACEETGDRWLFFRVRKMIRYQILKFRDGHKAICCPIDMWSDVQQEPDAQDIDEELYNEFRMVEANLRSDDFINPGQQYEGKGRLTRYVTRIRMGDSMKTVVRYQVTNTDKRRRQFQRRTAAIAFLTQQNTPPRKTGTIK